MKFAFITTTINKPIFLEDYLKNFKSQKKFYVEFFVIGDRKTPKNVLNYLNNLQKKYNHTINYFDFKKTQNFLKKNKSIFKIFPKDNAVRKYIGNILAYQKNFDVIMMVDDDNFLNDKNYLNFASTAHTNNKKKIKSIKSSTKWFNIYKSLEENKNLKFYPRGFPWSKRYKTEKVSIKQRYLKTCFINGLVLEDPDIDAITRLYHPIKVTKFNSKKFGHQYSLEPGTWSSFNNQNSIIPSDVVPLHFTPPSAGRNSDIWASFFMCKLAECLNERIVFGSPLVTQLRNKHDLWDDLNLEFQNNYLTDYFVNLLRSLKIDSTNKTLIASIICNKSLKKLKSDKTKLKIKDYNYIKNFFEEYLIWINYFKN